MGIYPIQRGRGEDALAPRDLGRVHVRAGCNPVVGNKNGPKRGEGPHPAGDAGDYGGRGVWARGEVLKVQCQVGFFELMAIIGF